MPDQLLLKWHFTYLFICLFVCYFILCMCLLRIALNKDVTSVWHYVTAIVVLLQQECGEVLNLYGVRLPTTLHTLTCVVTLPHLLPWRVSGVSASPGQRSGAVQPAERSGTEAGAWVCRAKSRERGGDREGGRLGKMRECQGSR